MTASPGQRSRTDLWALRSKLAAYVERTPRTGPMVMAGVVGFFSGLAAVLFLALIDLVAWLVVDQLFERALAGLPWWMILFAPALGGLLVGPIVQVFAPEARGHGIPEVMNAVETRGGRIRPRVAAAKAVASALTIGSGGSAGTEGPIVQIGSAFGSTMAQFLRLSVDNTRLLVAAGAAGGIAAVFNAPIAGVFFALEVILRRFSTRNFSVVVLSSVVATTTAVAFRGDAPVLLIPAYRLVHPGEIGLYAILGVLCAFAGVLFTRVMYAGEGIAERQRLVPLVILPAVGGLLVGILGLWHTGALGTGDAETDAALLGELGARTMLLLFWLKMAATVLTLASGGSGGVFRPSLMMGAMLGGAFGVAVNAAFPEAIASSGAYATVGMAAMFAGAARAPITSLLIIFEMTRDYNLMIPLMTAVVAATAVATFLDPLSIYTRRLYLQGIHIDEETEGANVMQALRVADAMGPVTITLASDTPLDEVAGAFRTDRDAVALVLDADGLVLGIVTNTDLNEALDAGDTDATAIDLASVEVRTIGREQSLHDALGAFAAHRHSALPVVDPSRPRAPVGILRRSDITNAYAAAVERHDFTRRRHLLRDAVDEDIRYLDYQVRGDSPADGRRLRNLPLTEDAVVVAVRRDGRTLIPRGNTELIEGDRVTLIATAHAVDSIRALFEV